MPADRLQPGWGCTVLPGKYPHKERLELRGCSLQLIHDRGEVCTGQPVQRSRLQLLPLFLQYVTRPVMWVVLQTVCNNF